MKAILKKYSFLSKIAVFIGIPLLVYFLQDFPRRTVLKESLSVLTILSFTFMGGQFYLTRGYRAVENKGRMGDIVKAHKFIGYFFGAVLLFHPYFIVFPRYFEGGVKPLGALWQIVTTLENSGVVLGIIAWFMMIVLGISSLLRRKLFKSYRMWRWFHGLLSLLFIGLAAGHVITLGRHSAPVMTIFYLLLISGGVTVLVKTYISEMVIKKGLQEWLNVKEELPLAEENL
ncbi:MAG: ferric reductase-like transmembrane domain-containing protein [Calditrichia bacterium]